MRTEDVLGWVAFGLGSLGVLLIWITAIATVADVF